MKQSWYSINALAADVAEISIFEEIGAWGIDAKQFIAEFRAIAAPTVKLFINSPGGSVFDALAMFNAMRMSGKTIEVHVLGVAASAASYIAMVGDKVVMPENTFMFLHNPINGVYGNAEDMRDMADVLDKIGASLTATYAKRWNGEAEALAAVLAAETYLSAAECLQYGLCDEVTPEMTVEAKFDLERVPEAVRLVAFKPVAVEPPVVAAEPSLPELIVAEAAAAGLTDFAAALAADAAITNAAELAGAIKAAKDITALCKIAGHEAKAAGLIRARTSVADARKALAEALALADEAAHVDTAPRLPGAPAAPNQPAASAVNSTNLWAQIHAMKKVGV